jgi:predicted acylesterase/phospholipase RssA
MAKVPSGDAPAQPMDLLPNHDNRSTEKHAMASFKIGINMAGAISAGAYTAGVLDFLTEALDEWYKAKANGELVPAHDISIEVFCGASAGGMCAAISAVMLQEDFEHIHDTSVSGTNNRFFESWVNKIDITELLKTQDLKQAPPVVSLLDSTIIEEIAAYALQPPNPLPPPRPYVSPNLTLFLSLTNLRGVPYSLNGEAPGSIEETTFFYGDRLRFQTVRPDSTAPQAPAHAVDLTKTGAAGGWDLLQTAAMATGAFPVFLAPRILPRTPEEYMPGMWQPVTADPAGPPVPIAPCFPNGLGSPFQTLNVDGGVTNNDPFNFAHDFLSAVDPAISGNQMASNPFDADRAVISIAPFPTTDKFDSHFDARKNSSIFSALPRLFNALISQSRFFGESLTEIMTGTTFSRFVVAPSDDLLAARHHGSSAAVQPAALQCATLGAFGGFFERGFRAHDYALGRRNCQKFLCDHFVLPSNNVIIASGLNQLDPAARQAVLQRFGRLAPVEYSGKTKTDSRGCEPVLDGEPDPRRNWLPIIPLCAESVWKSIPPVPRTQITPARLSLIVDLVLKRFRAVASVWLGQIPSWPLRLFLRPGPWFIALLAKAPLTNALKSQLGDSYRDSAQ